MTTQLPLYQCHKRVRAAKIVDVRRDSSAPVNAKDTWAITVQVDGTPIHYTMDFSWVAKHQPQIGGYFVEYEDGYTSFSPAAPFEAGYSKVPPPVERTVRAAFTELPEAASVGMDLRHLADGRHDLGGFGKHDPLT